MKKLWAPWRAPYIRRAATKKSGACACIFCSAYARHAEQQVIFRTRHAVAMLNLFPYNNGHLMVAPKRHIPDMSTLSPEELLDLWQSVEQVRRLLAKVLKPHGFNIGMNIGAEGGAGITEHVHIHIVPRWRGDTNFMPVVSGTKVISESLEEVRKALVDAQRSD